MQEQEAIKSLYAIITGKQYEPEGSAATVSLSKQRIWESAVLLFRLLSPADEDISRLLFYKFTETPPDKVPFKQKEERKSITQSEKALDSVNIALESGIIPWTVEVDGIPTKWMLNYNQAHLPAKRGDCISFQGEQYRISKLYGTMLNLTSIESDVMYMNQREVIS